MRVVRPVSLIPDHVDLHLRSSHDLLSSQKLLESDQRDQTENVGLIDKSFTVDEHYRRLVTETKMPSQNNDVTRWVKVGGDGHVQIYFDYKPRLKRSKESLQLPVKRQNSSDSIARRTKRNRRLPKCETYITWRDLGEDHFPRFIRVASCDESKPHCRRPYCRLRSFTVYLLRRLTDSCQPVFSLADLHQQADDRQLVLRDGAQPIKLVEKWAFEERAIPFCCDCVYSSPYFR